MTGHHPVTAESETETETDTNTIPMFPALSRMERRPELQPRRYDREPYWRAPITPPSRECYVPHWNWHNRTGVPETEQLLTLDANGAYLSALGGIKVGHSQLSHHGGTEVITAPRDVMPGYYQISIPHWAFDGTIVHPLGDSSRLETETAVWVAHPTLVLLLELQEEGVLGEFMVLDAWIARAACDFRKWTAHLKQVRTELLDSLELAQTDAARAAMGEMYTAFKEGYSAALSMMLTGEKCKTQRPDWAHAVYAQHAASMWRKAWRWTGAGRPLISMGHTDELTVIADDLPEMMSRAKPPFRFDPSGRTLGAMKPKTVEAGTREPLQGDSLPTLDEGDVL
ncbi:hypothetical protein [Streptomyces sp. NRRL WC-3774]|uniref:hypothetical protein n=1 Tax=Streptomyces sp. NRRL WC-3774 TaxID=1463937 RepID=UPI0004C62FCC|nr:hypothetical protein [Streptomyces sp. NRRL WC-3774]